MKAKFFALLAVVLAVVSCQKDVDNLDVNMGGDVATISVTLPEDAITRAGGVNSAQSGLANTTGELVRVIFEVYYQGNTNADLRQYAYLEEGVTTANFEVRLVPNRDYTFVAWADQVNASTKENNYFDVTDLKNVQILDWTAMDECRDAYTATEFVENFNSSMGITLTLTRPFAKLRVKNTDMAQLNDLGIMPTKATVTYITKHYGAFNAFEGKVIDDSKNRDIKHELYTIASYGENVEADADMTLFTDYFFATDNDEVINFTFDVYDQDNKLIKSNAFNTAIPVKRNNLTTIAGNILTDGNNINVEVKPEFGGEKEWPSEEAEKLAAAAMFGGEVTLTEDVVLNQPLEVKNNMTLDLGGYTITTTLEREGRHHYAIDNYGTLTIKGNGAINARGIENFGTMTIDGNIVITNVDTNGGAAIWNEGDLVINGGTFKTNASAGTGSYGAALNTRAGGKAVVNDGTFEAYSQLTYAVINEGETVIYNATVKGKHGAVCGAETNDKTTIYGGSFELMENPGISDHCTYYVSAIYGGSFSLGNNTDSGAKVFYESNIAPGYYALQYETGKYTVQAFDAASRTLTINSKDEFLKLSTLDAKWAEFFSDGNGIEYNNYTTQNGGKGTDFYYKWEWTIKLNVDIDFENETLNAPISVTKFGCFDGQNHTIKNVNIQDGLFVASSTKLQNIKLDNIDVTAGYDGNSTAGILASGCNAGIDNITIANSSVEGGKYTGGVVGYGYTDVTNCTLTNCVVKGGYKCGGVIGYICASNEAGHNVTGNTLTNCTVVAAPQQADNKTEFILGKVVGNYNCNGTCADNVIDNMTTTAKALIGKIEAGNVVNESNNYVSTNVDSSEELAEALANGENVVLTQDVTSEAATTAPYGNKYAFKQDGGVIDGNGHELYMECYGDDYGIMTSGGTIKNLTITEGCRAVMIMYPQQDVVLDNVKIGGDGVLYPINTGEAGAEGVNLIVTNSVLAGWTSYGNIESASFTNVEFKQGTYYNNIYGRVLKPYVNTTFTNCSFVEHMNLDLSSLTNGHKIVMKNCTVNGQAVTVTTFTIPTTDAQYDTELFTIDLPSWATSINDCVVFE